jgi:hypothetical protein
VTHVGYVVAGYTISAAAIGGYAWWVLARSRSLRSATDVGAMGAPVLADSRDRPDAAG